MTWMVYSGLRGMERAAQWLCTMQTAHTGTLWSRLRVGNLHLPSHNTQCSQNDAAVRRQSRHAYHSSIRHSLFTHSRTSLNRKGREGWEGPPLTLSLCRSSYNSLYTCRNGIMLLQCMLDLSLHVSLKQGAPQWQMSCTHYCVNHTIQP